MRDATSVSFWRRYRGLIISTVLSYALAWFFGSEIRDLNPNGVLQHTTDGGTVRLPAFAYGFNAIAITLFFVGIAFTVAGLLVATSFAHYPFSQQARSFARSSAMYTGLMAVGMALGQLAQRGYL